jgi:hypothetical protein
MCKGGRSANPQFFLDLQTFRKCDNLQICDLCGQKTSANPQKTSFFLTNIDINALIKSFTKINFNDQDCGFANQMADQGQNF